jgi:hypothetical protein
MASGFDTNELLKSASNYPLTKGDLPGHAFHGNQYTEGSGGSYWAASRANVLAGTRIGVVGVSNAVEHNKLAADHTALAEKLRRDGHDEAADAHLAAARAHNTASAAHARVAVIENRGKASSDGPTMARAVGEARNAALAAAVASSHAHDLTRQINK